jgi:hypothetical protein
MRKTTVRLIALLLPTLAIAGVNPPPEWVKGFWEGYKVGREEVLKELNNIKEVLLIKKKILQGKLPPCYVENGRCKLFAPTEWKNPTPKLPKGYYVVIDTSNLTTPQKYYLAQKLRESGFAVFDRGELWVGQFLNGNDAQTIEKEIEKKWGVSTYVVEVK